MRIGIVGSGKIGGTDFTVPQARAALGVPNGARTP